MLSIKTLARNPSMALELCLLEGGHAPNQEDLWCGFHGHCALSWSLSLSHLWPHIAFPMAKPTPCYCGSHLGELEKQKGYERERERERNAKGTDKNLERKCESIIFQKRPSTPFFGPSGNPHPLSRPQEIHPWLDPGTCDPQKCFWCSMHPRHVAEGSRGEWPCPQASGRPKRGARVVNAEG